MMKLFILLSLATALVSAHPQKANRQMVMAGDSSSSGKSFSEFKSASKNFGAMHESMDMANMFGGGGMGGMPPMPGMGWGMPGMPMPGQPGPGEPAPAADAAGAALAPTDSMAAAAPAETADAGAGDADDQSACKKNCIEEGELGPIDGVAVARIHSNENGKYGVFSTYKTFSKLAELIRGQPLESKDELKQLCLHSQYTKSRGHLLRLHGFTPAKTYAGTCQISKTGLSVSCTNDAANSDNKAPNSYPAQLSSVWTDGKSAVLVVVCLSDGPKIWIVVSTEKAALSDETKKTVLAKVNELGLDAVDPVDLPLDDCK